jgi:hypothetical protein
VITCLVDCSQPSASCLSCRRYPKSGRKRPCQREDGFQREVLLGSKPSLSDGEAMTRTGSRIPMAIPISRRTAAFPTGESCSSGTSQQPGGRQLDGLGDAKRMSLPPGGVRLPCRTGWSRPPPAGCTADDIPPRRTRAETTGPSRQMPAQASARRGGHYRRSCACRCWPRTVRGVRTQTDQRAGDRDRQL